MRLAIAFIEAAASFLTVAVFGVIAALVFIDLISFNF